MTKPVLLVEGATTLVAYEIEAHEPVRWFHVAIRADPYGPDLLTFAGAVNDLHDFLLGLHNVLSDAAESPDGRSEQVVLQPTEAVDLVD